MASGSKRAREKRRRKRQKAQRRTCEGKVRYRREPVAIRAAVRLGHAHYRCRFCGGWHLTSKAAPQPPDTEEAGE